MLHLLLAIASSAMVSIIMRLSEKRGTANVGMLAVNYITCLAVAGYDTGFTNLFLQTSGIRLTAVMGLVNGFFYLGGFVLLQLNIRKNGVVLSSTFMKLGLLVPIAVSVCFFGETPQLFQVLGFLIAVAAIILINFEKKQTAIEFKSGLLLLLLTGGSADAMSKVFEELGDPALSPQFLLYTFGTAFLLCLCLTLCKKERLGWAEAVFGVLIGIPNYFSASFLLKALEQLPAVIIYPTYSVTTILVVSLAGVCFFKERLSRRQQAAIAAILVALVLLNL